MSAQHMGCFTKCKVTGLEYGLCFVYGLHSVTQRRGTWEGVRSCFSGHNVPWMVLGDFNCVMNHEERLHGRPVRPYECDDMVRACSTFGLVDVPCVSNDVFTWTRGRVWSKIDRVMVNDKWLEQGIYCRTEFLEKWNFSDHKVGLTRLQ